MRFQFFLFLQCCNQRTTEENDPAEGDVEIEQMLLQLEEELAQALLNKNPEPLHRILDDEYILTNAIGKIISKQQVIEKFHSTVDEMSFFSVTNGEVRVHLYDDAAVITGTQIQHATKKDELLFVKLRFTSMYAKREGNWKLVAGHKSESKSTA